MSLLHTLLCGVWNGPRSRCIPELKLGLHLDFTVNDNAAGIMFMVVHQSSLLSSSCSSIRACSEVGRSRNVSAPGLCCKQYCCCWHGCHVIFFNINSHPSSFLPSSCLHRLWQPRTNILNSILIVKSISSASLQQHLFVNPKHPWSSVLLGSHSRKHLQRISLSLHNISFKVSLAACYFNHDLYIKYKLTCISQLLNFGSSYILYLRQKTSTPLLPWLWCLAQSYNFVHLTSRSNSTSCFHSSPDYEASITVNKARVQEDVQQSHLVNCQLIKFMQFPGNKRSTFLLRLLKS